MKKKAHKSKARRRAIAKKPKRMQNYGQGDLFNFHGAFQEKKDAVAKETKTPGAFIKTMWFRSGPRYAVLTNRATNPVCGKRIGNKHTCSRKPKHRGPCLPQGATLRPKSRIPKHWLGKRRRRNAAEFDQAIKKLFPRKPIAKLSTAQLAQALHYSEQLKAGKKNPAGLPTRKNYSDATDLYTQFHGRGPDRVTERQFPIADYSARPELAQLGKLVSLTIGEETPKKWRRKITWGSREAPDLAAEPNGRQLYLVGGSQNLDGSLSGLPIDAAKTMIDLGFVYQVEYFTQKKFDNFQPVTYYHDLGEETGDVPRGVYDRLHKLIHIVGGAYKVKPEGIVN